MLRERMFEESDGLVHWTFKDGVSVHEELENVEVSKIRAVCNRESRTKWTTIASRGRLYQFIALSDEDTQHAMRQTIRLLTATNDMRSVYESIDSNVSTSGSCNETLDRGEIEPRPLIPIDSWKQTIDYTPLFFDGGSIHELPLRFKKRFVNRLLPVFGWVNECILGEVASDVDGITELLCQNQFMKAPSEEVVNGAIAEFIDRTSNEALATAICAACARETVVKDLSVHRLDFIPNHHRLKPMERHAFHNIFNGMLLHPHGVRGDEFANMCSECIRALKSDRTPMFALANGLWIGDIPQELVFLTLPERILIAKYFPAAYIIKLYPKKTGARRWDSRQLYSGLRGNVSTYRLHQSQISTMIDGSIMPQGAKVLTATVGITFVGPKNLPEKTLPNMFKVRRARVKSALEWLKKNNPLYKDITISASRLAQLPEDDIPYELLATTKFSTDVNTLYAEQEGYVPSQEVIDEDNEEESASMEDTDVDDDETVMEPGVVPLAHLGVVDVDGVEVTESELMAHALANCSQGTQEEDYMIRRGSAFVNEYARVDAATGQRNDGGPSDANHLLGCFPTLFPFGRGGFETERTVNVPYEAHVRWALQYEDRRFRKDPHFPFQVFGICQKRQVCRASMLQMKRHSYFQHQNMLSTITTKDLTKASEEETRGVPFSNLAVRILRNQLSAVKTKVQGSDESRNSIRSKIWGTNILHNPPSLWVTINPSDMQDPIAQVFAGVEIDLNRFCNTAGPDSVDRALNMAGDPYASAKFFHFMIETILEVLIGVSKRRNGTIVRKEGILGIVKSYVGTVEAQGRGSLHLHLLLWLAGAPTALELKRALANVTFREKIKHYISKTIRADLDGKEREEVMAMKKVDAVCYSRPLDPRNPSDVRSRKTAELDIARMTQLHKCSYANCLKIVKGRAVCKRRAPFPLAVDDWVDSVGRWGPRRLCGYLNNWNPPLLMSIRSNHDIKLIMNGGETSVLTWYITNYASKKQQRSSNVSALLAKRVAFHLVEERRRRDLTDVNKRLIQRCANTLTRDREFSGPEIISYLMGWGDRFESHHYVTIYVDAITSALKDKFPGLRNPRWPQGRSTHIPKPAVVGESRVDGNEDASNHIITMVDGVIALKDQLHEYMFRGEEMIELNLFTFVLDTYDTKAEHTAKDIGNEDATFGNEGRGFGRPRNRRIAYRQGFDKCGHTRVFRTEGHETLPQFVGRWMPRNDRPNDREMYCGSMLALLKPWTDLSDLKGHAETFEESFDQFVANSSKKIRDILENIQYYYECYDGAKKRREEVQAEDMQRTIDYEEDTSSEDLTANAMEFDQEAQEVTEEDVELAYESRSAMRECLYAQVAMTTAIDCGVFYEVKSDTVFFPGAERAATEELEIFQGWADQLKAATRREAVENGGGLFVNNDNYGQMTGVHDEGGEGVGRVDDIAMSEQPLLPLKTTVAALKDEATNNLKRRIELSVGMKAMVTLNIATEADVANVIYFKPDMETNITFDGIPKGIIPILPSLTTFSVGVDGQKIKVQRRQVAIVPGYAFTDYKAQGQTLECVLVDIAKPPSGKLSPFSVYVALSRSRGRKTIRILRDFDAELFMHHPSEDLREDMQRLERLDMESKAEFESGERRSV
ncbi:hypothetical protein BYT27DRAFT_7302151 [Phlegmacium glaucopus]|nr:hypothetical protein BYT27DRAFT_7302151 [Phlegmacium glaucopus]